MSAAGANSMYSAESTVRTTAIAASDGRSHRRRGRVGGGSVLGVAVTVMTGTPPT